jgi:hypothetical protein
MRLKNWYVLTEKFNIDDQRSDMITNKFFNPPWTPKQGLPNQAKWSGSALVSRKLPYFYS